MESDMFFEDVTKKLFLLKLSAGSLKFLEYYRRIFYVQRCELYVGEVAGVYMEPGVYCRDREVSAAASIA